MNFSDRKLEAAIVAVSFILLLGLGSLLKSPVQSALGLQDINYEMPRPKASFWASLFELGDRKVSRKYINPYDKKKNTAKKTEDQKKTEKQNTIAQKKKDALKKTAAKKSKVEVEVVGEDPNVALTGSDTGGDQSPNMGYANNTRNTNTADTGKQKDLNEKMSVDQWRALILAQPTAENVSKMIKAFESEEISAEGFYGIVADLYKDNRPEVQTMGLMAAKSFYYAMAFSVTAEYYQALNPEVQKNAYTYLKSYGASSRLSALAGALKSDSPATVEIAAEIVIDTYQNVKGGGVGVVLDPRASRGDINVASTGNFAQFVPIFQDLAKSNDPHIVNLANSALSQMQNLVASN